MGSMIVTSLTRICYQRFAKPFFFKRDPEDVHDSMSSFGEFLGNVPFVRGVMEWMYAYKHPMLEQDVCGIHFANPVGLSAGFDKNARLTRVIPSIGFGFEEVGSITGEPCVGNPKPRLWRLPESKGLVVYYGLKNDGCEAISERLKKQRFSIPIGTSVAKTNAASCVDKEKGIADYVKAFRAFVDIGAYFTINISCPNTFGGEPFNDPIRLEALLTEIDKIKTKKPIFLKISADMFPEQLDTLVRVTDQHRVHGFIIANLTKQHHSPQIHQHEIKDIEKGGVSGKPVSALSNHLIQHLYRTTQGRYVIMGCGGIFTAEDAYQKIRSGASLVQMITGMIFEGPQVIGEINRGLVHHLKKDGFSNISEAVGCAVKETCIQD